MRGWRGWGSADPRMIFWGRTFSRGYLRSGARRFPRGPDLLLLIFEVLDAHGFTRPVKTGEQRRCCDPHEPEFLQNATALRIWEIKYSKEIMGGLLSQLLKIALHIINRDDCRQGLLWGGSGVLKSERLEQ